MITTTNRIENTGWGDGEEVETETETETTDNNIIYNNNEKR